MLKRTLCLSFALSVVSLGCSTGGEDDRLTFGSYSTYGDSADDDADDESGEDMDESGDTVGDGDGDTSGDGDGDGDTGDGDGDTGDGDGDTGDGDTGGSCGDGVADPGEACDGTDFNGLTCLDYGFDLGDLACVACAINTAGCSTSGGGQPNEGLYSMCLLSGDCPNMDGCATVTMMGDPEPYDGYCTDFCTLDSECAANLGGTAIPGCGDAGYCEINCTGGLTCPGGMECVLIEGDVEVCY